MNKVSSYLAQPFFSIVRSVRGFHWLYETVDEDITAGLCQRTGLADSVARILVRRKTPLDKIETYLAPTLRSLLPNPFRLKDMTNAAQFLATAIMRLETIAVFADYDVDGAVSAALMKRFIEAVGGQSILYVPDRLNEGYGPNTTALLKLKEAGAQLIVTVDCGTSAFQALAKASEIGLPVIVIDHHKAEERLPKTVALVNPNRTDDTSQHGYLAAVGVVFLLIVATNRTLHGAGWYTKNARSAPDLMQWLDLVALGTVCDMVPLIGINRAFVTQGLKVIGCHGNIGLNALIKEARIQEPIRAWHMGFILGPRINAGGRIGKADLGARLLSTNDQKEALVLAKLLNSYNKNRQLIESQVLTAALDQLDNDRKITSLAQSPQSLIFVASQHWHPGVVGIIASRLKERYNKPAFVLSIDGDLVKGSARSIPGVDLGSTVITALEEGLLENGGGHPMAAGFTLKVRNLVKFRSFLESHCEAQLKSISRQTPILHLDGILNLGEITETVFIDSLYRLEPFGIGNPEPCFAFTNARVLHPRVIRNHVCCTLVNNCGAYLEAIVFHGVGVNSNLGHVLLAQENVSMHVAGTLHKKIWHNKKCGQVQIFIQDVAYA